MLMILRGLSIALLAGYGASWIGVWLSGISGEVKDRRSTTAELPFLWWLSLLQPFKRFPAGMEQIAWRLSQIVGQEKAQVEAMKQITRLLALGYAVLWAGASAIWLDSGTFVYFEIAVMLFVLLPFLWLRDLDRKWKKIRRQVQLDFQPFVNKVALLVNAGDTLPHAVVRSITVKSETKIPDPFNREMRRMSEALHNHESFASVMEDFSRRIRQQEISQFTTVVLIHYRRGGDECSAALRQMSGQMWQRRMALVRTMAEEAAALLTVPLVLMFLLVMILVAAPAIMLVQ